ncbi:hypothetical protein MTIM_01670 [Mycobacterium timonense]|uniref:Uncharacterized protein n=1 Tax=Mycobacterium timonense TaxID=701043 RepID=A0A7I9Z095_9MYCO|nr:hypothetical protein MTIM_01670 [Mycobacterium timonense]
MSTPLQRSLAAQIASHESWAKTADRAARTAAAREAAFKRFENLVDPDGVLPPGVRTKMAEHARQAHYKRMALKSAKVRRLRASAGQPH